MVELMLLLMIDDMGEVKMKHETYESNKFKVCWRHV